MSKSLTAREVEALVKDDMHRVDHGLYLHTLMVIALSLQGPSHMDGAGAGAASHLDGSEA